MADGGPPSTVDPEAAAHARRVSEASGSSFLAGIRILPTARREAMYAIYAFCREVDDIADDPLPLDEKRRRLADWRREIDNVCGGVPETLTGRALHSVIAPYGLRKADLLDLIDGMEMDADETATHGPDLDVLDRYCDRVASAVGRLSVRVFGDDGDDAQQVARFLGRALQLTNILRDLDEDAARGRLYLPRELLERHGVSTREPAAVLRAPGLPAVCEDLAALARQHYADAAAAMARCRRGRMRPALLMMHVYRRLLDGLAARGWTRLHVPVKVSKAAKLWIILRHGFI